MKLETLRFQGFRCFGPEMTEVALETGVTGFIGCNGAGKTAVFQAISCLFGVSKSQRDLSRRDFHVLAGQEQLASGAKVVIEAIFAFPEVGGDGGGDEGAVPEFFLQMAVDGPGGDLKARMRLEAIWMDDGTPEGSVESETRWIRTLGDDFEWDECTRVAPSERGSVQLIYVPAARDAARQVGALLKGRLWQAARWSDAFREESSKNAEQIQEQFSEEAPAKFVVERLVKRWQQVHKGDTDTTPQLRLIEHRFEELMRKASFAFFPDEAGQERELAELSDGQRSLFHIALTAATLEVERDARAMGAEDASFDPDKIRTAYLTILAIEEPENSLAPFFLSRILEQAREIGAFDDAQVVLSSHAPAILSRIEPEEVRFLRLDRQTRASEVRSVVLPEDDEEASRYVRLAVRAYPELYFARFVILAEGDSERIVIPRVADAMGVPLDPSCVPVVPLGGRYVRHFWRLLEGLGIPFATLADLDLGRQHGGVAALRELVAAYQEVGRDLNDSSHVDLGIVALNELDSLDDAALGPGADEPCAWIEALEQLGAFFSAPLDVDFAMLRAFPDAYKKPKPGGRGPRIDAETIATKKSATLKTGGKPDLYDGSYDESFGWYPYLFLNRSKPEAHLLALSRISDEDLAAGAPDTIQRLIARAGQAVGLADEA